MTRDKAVKICVNKISSYGILYGAESLVDRYVELGALKLEEPKSVRSRFNEAISPIGNVGPWADNIWEVVHS